MDKNFQGVLFTLKKRMQSINVSDSKYYKFHIFGYYDGVDVHTTDKWYELRPKGLQIRGLQVDLQTPFIDQYTIRAIMPEDSNTLEKEHGFAYSFWKKIGTLKPSEAESVESYYEGTEEERSKFPFFTMSVINLSRYFVKKKG